MKKITFITTLVVDEKRISMNMVDGDGKEITFCGMDELVYDNYKWSCHLMAITLEGKLAAEEPKAHPAKSAGQDPKEQE